jgi:hypothetical protein
MSAEDYRRWTAILEAKFPELRKQQDRQDEASKDLY